MGFRVWGLGVLWFFCYAYAQDDPRTSYEGHDDVIPYTWSSEVSNQNLVLWSYELSANHPLSRYQRLNTTLRVGADVSKVFFLDDGFVRALDLDTGRLAWQHSDNEAEQLLYARGILVVRASQKENEIAVRSTVYALEATTGQEVWRLELPDTFSTVYGLELVNDKVLITLDDISLAAFDLRTGREVWQLEASYPLNRFTVADVINNIVLAYTINSGAVTTSYLTAFDLGKGDLLWDDVGVSKYLGYGGNQLYALSDEYVGPYRHINRPGAVVINIYDLHQGFQDQRVFDVNPPTCYESACPNVQGAGQVVYDNNFIYVNANRGIVRFAVESDDKFLGEQVSMPDDAWLAGPYRGQFFVSDGQGLIIRDTQDMVMGGWRFGDAAVSRLDIYDKWLLVGFKNGHFAIADLDKQVVKAHLATAESAFERRTFGKSYLIGDKVLLQSDNTLYFFEFPH
jgi:PQQ-like domain